MEATAIAEKEPSHSITTATTKEKSSILLQTAKAYVFGDDPCNKIPIHILLDSGSQRTYVAEEIKKKPQLKAEAVETIKLNTFSTEKYSKKQCEHVVLNLEVESDAVPGNRTVDLLLGIDYYHVIVQGEVRKGGKGPIAVKSKLGWLLSGPVSIVENDVNFTTNVIASLVFTYISS